MKLQNNQSPAAQEFRDKIRASFRTISLSKPNYSSILKSLFYAENFSDH
jgi:muramidase (phage lysozyme)